MQHILIHTFLGAIVLAGLCTPQVLAQKKNVEIQKKWTGSVEDDKLLKIAPEVIVSKKTLEAVWKAWKIEGQLPDIDFTKAIVIVAHTSGSRLDLKSAALDEKGNLEAVGISTRDFGPGFRFLLASVSREGVVTVNGKKLPSE